MRLTVKTELGILVTDVSKWIWENCSPAHINKILKHKLKVKRVTIIKNEWVYQPY